jgi:hypothetical protein
MIIEPAQMHDWEVDSAAIGWLLPRYMAGLGWAGLTERCLESAP